MRIQYQPPFHEATGKTKEELAVEKPITLLELIELLTEKYGNKFKALIWDKKDEKEFHRQLSMIINGNTYRDEKFLNTPLDEDSKVWFTYVFFGG